MIAFTMHNTVFLSKATDAAKFTAGQELYLFRGDAPVSPHPVVVADSDDCIGWIKVKDPHRVCKQARRGDDLRKEVRR